MTQSCSPKGRLLALALALLVTPFALGGSCGKRPGPFRAQPDTSEGLVNVSSDLMAVLENGSLPGRCENYWNAVAGGSETRYDELMCGKELFFYEGYDTLGVPEVLVEFLIDHFPEFGPGASALGMVEDPTSPDDWPLGLTRGHPLGEGSVPTLAFSCASCHFGQLPDGRYAVGAPNHAFEYGEFNLAVGTFPLVAVQGGGGHDPAALARIQPYLDRLDFGLTLQLIGVLLDLLPALSEVPAITPATENAWASWSSGTMDFLIAPVPVDDEVHTVSKISSLWGMPTENDVARYGMANALLGHTGVTHSLASFLDAFVLFGDGDTASWTPEQLAPLVSYIESLRAPDNPSPPDPTLVDEGLSLFRSAGCIDCHGGARGAGRRVYDFAEIGGDTAMMYWMDAELDGIPCCGMSLGPGETLTQGLRPPRLVGMWAQSRFLHNGSVESLDDLFCRNGPRPTVTVPPFGDGGHDFTCTGLTPAEKDALTAFLLSH